MCILCLCVFYKQSFVFSNLTNYKNNVYLSKYKAIGVLFNNHHIYTHLRINSLYINNMLKLNFQSVFVCVFK